MPRLSDTQVPSYRRHKQSGQAIVTLSGKDILLGKYGSSASREKYRRVINEWLAAGRQLPTDPATTTIAEVVVAFRKHAKIHYRKNGRPTSEAGNIDHALAPLLKLYARTPAADFGPLKLKAVRTEMIRLGWVRSSINRQIRRIRLVFKWAVENEMIPPAVHEGLRCVSALRAGRSEARESAPVRPVPVERVEAVLPHVSRQVAAMIRLQLRTGMRPGEVTMMRTCDIDTRDEVWVYRPEEHKTEHCGNAREIPLGPAAQEVIRPFLKTDLAAYLFSPADAARERRERAGRTRKTPLSCGNGPGTNRVRKPRKKPGDRYSTESYCKAIYRGCELAFGMPVEYRKPPKQVDEHGHVIPETEEQKAARLGKLQQWHQVNGWHPHRIRHTVGTQIKDEFGYVEAQMVLGHKTLNSTMVYAESNPKIAKQIAAQRG